MTKSMLTNEWKSCCRRSPSPPSSHGVSQLITLILSRRTSNVFPQISLPTRKSIASTCYLALTMRRSIILFTLMDSRPLARQLISSLRPSLIYWQKKVLSVLPVRQKLSKHPWSSKRMSMITSWITNGPSLLHAWTRAGPLLLMMAVSSMSLVRIRTTFSRKALCLLTHSHCKQMPSSVQLCKVFSSKMKLHQLSEILTNS